MIGTVVLPGRDGALLRLKVSPGAARDAVLGVAADRLRVSVRAAPEKGRANKAVIALLAKTFRVPKSALEITAGGGASRKTVRVGGIGAEAVAARIRELA